MIFPSVKFKVLVIYSLCVIKDITYPGILLNVLLILYSKIKNKFLIVYIIKQNLFFISALLDNISILYRNSVKMLMFPLIFVTYTIILNNA